MGRDPEALPPWRQARSGWASLEVAALVYPRELRVEVWRRGADGAWPEEPQVLKQVSDVLTVDLVDAAVPLAAIYEGIDLAD